MRFKYELAKPNYVLQFFYTIYKEVLKNNK